MEHTSGSGIVGQSMQDDASARSMPADQEVLSYLREVCELLWPPPAVITLQGGRTGEGRRADRAGRSERRSAHWAGSEFVLVPGIRRPPLLVPAGGRVAAAAVRPRSRGARIGARALSLGLASGLGGAVLRRRMRVDTPPGADTIEAYLQEMICPDISISMYLGPPRANRKPVLQLLTAAGQPIGFAKIGVNDLTRDLVRSERASLARLAHARLRKITVPRILHYGEWRGLDVLVLSPLPTWRRHHSIRRESLASAMEELARVEGVVHAPLLSHSYLGYLRDRLTTVDDGTARDELLLVLDDLANRAGREALAYGSWHGDWTPWNMANTSREMLVWDWERFAFGVPLGFDLLHYRLQSEVGLGRREPSAAAASCLEQASELLAPFSIGPRQARITAILYLAELATRYLMDRQAEAEAPRGEVWNWLIPAVVSATAAL